MTASTAAGREHRGRIAQKFFEALYLAIHRDAKRLEGARRGMHSAAAMRSNRALDQRAQLAGGLDATAAARLDDGARDAAGHALLAIFAKDARQLRLGLLVDEIVGA